MPNVRILLAAYNGAAYLRPLLDSLLAQDDSDFQIVASDDGSSDDTLQILDMKRSLSRAFSDVEEAARGCKFRDCTHTDEPGCQVREEISPERLAAYRALASSARFA